VLRNQCTPTPLEYRGGGGGSNIRKKKTEILPWGMSIKKRATPPLFLVRGPEKGLQLGIAAKERKRGLQEESLYPAEGKRKKRRTRREGEGVLRSSRRSSEKGRLLFR